jgi:hypothetical protein
MSFHERGDVTVLRASQQIAFPMSGDGAILDLCGSFPNGNGVDDLTLVVPAITRVAGAANPPLEAKMLNQLFFSALPALV